MTEAKMKKAPIWDLVGMLLTLDKRLLVVVPCLFAASWALNSPL